jgi:hypothetical protein
MIKVTVNTTGPLALHEFTVPSGQERGGLNNQYGTRYWIDVSGVFHEFNPHHIVKVVYREIKNQPDPGPQPPNS